MRATEAYAELLQLNRPVVTTRQAAARLKKGTFGTIKLLQRLAKHGLIIRLKKGLWALRSHLNPYSLAEYLTAPYPSYISLWTALYDHGMITQVPRVIYLISLDRRRRIETTLATYEVHRVVPELFGGFQLRDTLKIATPEKALFDTVYILGIKGKRYVRLPELELPKDFNKHSLEEWVERIPTDRLKTRTANHLYRVLAQASLSDIESQSRPAVLNEPALKNTPSRG